LSYFRTIKDPYSVITPIEFGVTFPEKITLLQKKYKDDIELSNRKESTYATDYSISKF
jgi:hypothetical protein